MDPTIDPTMMAQINKGLSAPMSPMTGAGGGMQAPPMPVPAGTPPTGMTTGAQPAMSPTGALPTGPAGGSPAPTPGASAPTNDMRNQIAASMQAQQMAQQNQQALAATRANPSGIDPMAQYQQGFQSGVTGQPAAQLPASYWS